MKRPDLEITKTMPAECAAEAVSLESTLQTFMIAHIISFFATAYREMYSAKTDLFGQLMRIIEVICIPVLFWAILSAIELVTLSLVRLFSSDIIADSQPQKLDKDDAELYKQG